LLRGVLILLLGGLLFACAPQAPPASDVPRLIAEETLPPPTITPLTLNQNQPTITVTLAPEIAVLTPTIQTTGFVLRTATPPNTLTPTVTDTPTSRPSATVTRTVTPTRTHTPTVTPTFTASFTPTITAIPSGTLVGAVAAPQVNNSNSGQPCTISWFFTPAPTGCPQSDALSSPAAMQVMENGVLIWIEEGRVIFVLYNDGQSPAWEVVTDTYQDGEILEANGLVAPPGFYLPQRGFGKLWLENDTTRQRLGWGVTPESGYTSLFQVEAGTQTRYLNGANGQVFALWDGQTLWQQIN